MWAHSKKLFINSSKSNKINFNPHKLLPLLNLSLNQQQIVSTTHIKLLGVSFLDDLKFNGDFDIIHNKCLQGIASSSFKKRSY